MAGNRRKESHLANLEIIKTGNHQAGWGGKTYGESGQNVGPGSHAYSDEALQPAVEQAQILLERRAGKANGD